MNNNETHRLQNQAIELLELIEDTSEHLCDENQVSGEKFYVPKVMLDTTKSIELSDKDQTTFTDFISWIENYNTYIMSMWDDKVNSNISKDDEDTVSQFVQIDNEDVA